MYAIVIEFDRTRREEVRREKRLWTFSEKSAAEHEAERFARLAQAGSTNFLKDGDKLTFQECRLYFVDTEDQQSAKQQVSAGSAQLLQHAFNPALNNPAYWEEFLAKLDSDESVLA